MIVKSAQTAAGLFATMDSTGALSAATTGPAGALYIDGTVNAASVTITGSNPYKWAVTLPALTAGQIVHIYITATIDSTSTGGIVWAANVLASGTIGADALASDTITAAKIASDAISNAKLADGAITAAKIASDAITSAKIADGAIDAGALASDTITAAKIASDAITNAKFADNAISAAKIADDAITSAKIAEDAIGADQLASSAITAAKIAADAFETAKFIDAYWDKLADHVLRRSWESAADSSDGDTKAFRSLLGAIAKLVNKVAVSEGVLTVYEEDDTTSLGTQAVTTQVGATPIIAMDTN